MVAIFMFWKSKIVSEYIYTKAIDDRITYISQLLYT